MRSPEDITDREHLTELCHDLINKALRCEQWQDEIVGDRDSYMARDYRAKEAAIRRLMERLP